MKRLLLLATALTLWPLPGFAQSNDDLNSNKNTDHVVAHSMGLDRASYSPLKLINKTNIKKLVPVWNFSLMNDAGELATPAVYDGVLYAINGKWTFAIDVETGRQLWRTAVETDPGVARVTQFGSFTRGGPTLYNGKLFRVNIDNSLVALDMKTGKEVWKQKFADWREGYYATGAPIVANGVVISGMAGGESTTRGFLDGWDPETGKKLWRRYTIPAPGEPGHESWPADSDAWTRGGGATWRSGSYDPELDLVYWGVGNAEPYNPTPRGATDALFTSSVLAIRPKTGEIACYFQYTPNDVYDVDGADEHVLADLQVDGQTRKVMIQANKNGFLFVLDRTNCKPISIKPYVKVNWASGYDMATGRPVHTDIYKKFVAGEEIEMWPQRGTNAVPTAFNPHTGLIYLSTWEMPRIQKIAPPKPQVLGADSTGVIARTPSFKPGETVGYFTAMNPLTGEKKWQVPLIDLPGSAGTLATDGGLIFTGRLTGEFLALDDETGKTLWSFKTGSSVNATAITYTYKGKQYVSVASGLGGSLARRWAADKVPTGGSMWTFALMPE
jgi:alcohol dehydrogenase (cytochrome c)